MENDNPANMSNQDLENDMEQRNSEMTKGNQERVNKSTAAEGELITPDLDESSRINMDTVYKADKEQDLDDLVHTQASEEIDGQDGSMPDPEEIGNWESNNDDINKISS